MEIKGVHISKIQLLLILILLAGLIFSLSLVQTRQKFKSKADMDIFNSLEVTGAYCNLPEGGQSNCQLDETVNSVTVNGIQRLRDLPPP